MRTMKIIVETEETEWDNIFFEYYAKTESGEEVYMEIEII